MNTFTSLQSSSAGNSHLCQPLRTLEELLSFQSNPVKWNSLVKPLAHRSNSRKATKNYLNLLHSIAEESDPNRREVLVCHDFKGKWEKSKTLSCLIQFCADIRLHAASFDIKASFE